MLLEGQYPAELTSQLVQIHLPGRPWLVGSKLTLKVIFLKNGPCVWLHFVFICISFLNSRICQEWLIKYSSLSHSSCKSLYTIWVRTTVLLHHWCDCSSFTVEYLSFWICHLNFKCTHPVLHTAFVCCKLIERKQSCSQTKCVQRGEVMRNSQEHAQEWECCLVLQVRRFCIL